MSEFEPQNRFLLRGSALLIGILTLWWFVLLGPMLYLLKGGAAAFVEIDEHASGDWTLRVPLDAILPATSSEPPRQIRSIDFDIPRDDAITFTFSLPLLWAVLLAAPHVKQRPLLSGTLLMVVIEVALLLAFAQITAREGASQLQRTDDAVDQWIRHVGLYLTVSVLPYVAPFVVALTVHRELREAVFSRTKTLDLRAPRHNYSRRV